jgi:rubredoxin
MKKHKCTVCGHIYDPVEGDPLRDIPPGTLFEDLPDDWTCPICNVGKDEYMELD